MRRARCRPTVFVPRPKVDSALVRLRRRAAPPVDGAVGRRRCSRSCGRVRAAPQDAAPRRSRRCSATAPRPCSTAAGIDAHARGPRRSGSTTGPRSPGARRTRRETRARPGHGVPEAHAVAPRARPARRRLPRPRGARRLARPAPRRARGVRGAAPGGVQRRGRSATTPTTTCPTDTRNLAFIAAEKLHGARRSVGSRRAARAAQADPRRRAGSAAARPTRPRRCSRCASCSTSTSTTTACSTIAAELGSDVPFCVRGGAAWMRGRGEIIEPVVAAAPGSRSSSRSRRSGSSTPDGLPRRGTSSAARVAQRVGARAAPCRRARPRAAPTTSSRRPRRVEPRLVEFRNALEAADRAARAARGERLGLRGAGRPTPRALPGLVDEVRRRLRVPVVGTTSVVARRPPRLSVRRNRRQ